VQTYCSYSYSSNMNMATHVHIHIRRIWPFFPYSCSTNIREYEYEFIEYSCIPGSVYPPLVHCTPHCLRRATVLFPSYLSPIPLSPHVLISPTATPPGSIVAPVSLLLQDISPKSCLRRDFLPSRFIPAPVPF
jgi:hypothetical protein